MSDKKVIALGYFDSVHKGHRKVIESAKRFANENGLTPVVFTFDGNLKKATSKCEQSKLKNVYSLAERKQIMEGLGITELFVMPATESTLNKTDLEFLDFLNSQLNIDSYFCGEDYRFGKDGKGNVNTLIEYALANGQRVEVVPTLLENEQKVSTSAIRELLLTGEIEKANQMLVTPFFITGEVFSDRKVGSKIGYPTLNIALDQEKLSPKDGVYAGHVYLDGKRYKTVMNCGARPTFNLNGKLVEAHVLDFEGDLYGKTVKLFFDGFLRDVQKFNSVEELKERISQDIQKVKKDYD